MKFIIIILMISQRVPNQLAYQRILPKGYPCIYKQWINDPLTGNKTWANNDIVRWNFMNSKRGTFDPYRSFIEITVSCTENQLPVGLLQIDNSAHSFINQLVLYSNNRQIERITQYSTLLAYLNDIGLNQFLSQGRQAQGLGYGNIQSSPYRRDVGSIGSAPRYCKNGSDTTGTYTTTNVFPTIGSAYPTSSQYYNQSSIFVASKAAKGHVSNSNPCLSNDINGGSSKTGSWTIPWAALDEVGYLNAMRTDYITPFIENKFPQSTQSIPNYELIVSANTSQSKIPSYYQPGIKYEVFTRGTINQTLYFSKEYFNNNHVINTSNFGFTSLFTPHYTKGTFQPFISPTVPQCMLQNGIITQTKFPIFRKRFKIPLASAVIGCLIDQSSYCLLPLESINDCMLELTLDPYAMFTSGYNDISEFDTTGMQIQQKRCWNIDRIQYKLHTYFFTDNQVQEYIRTSLYQQIVLVNYLWSLGNQYQIAGGTLVNNSYIVGCNSSNLTQLICLFVANDYQRYSFCRKHFRLSNCIRRFWTKMGVNYWPPQPFKGNGGNIMSNQYEDDNSIFIQNLYWANNYMFSKNSLPRINGYNFAINNRCYNPANKQSHYDPAMYQKPNYAFTSTSVNSDTAMGMPFIHQNRFIGKAAYIVPYSPFVPQQGLLQGVNVQGLSNFQVVFETDSTDAFPRDQTLYIFCRSSVVVKYGKDGIKTIGR